jgi:hypothetical protein
VLQLRQMSYLFIYVCSRVCVSTSVSVSVCTRLYVYVYLSVCVNMRSMCWIAGILACYMQTSVRVRVCAHVPC